MPNYEEATQGKYIPILWFIVIASTFFIVGLITGEFMYYIVGNIAIITHVISLFLFFKIDRHNSIVYYNLREKKFQRYLELKYSDIPVIYLSRGRDE